MGELQTWTREMGQRGSHVANRTSIWLFVGALCSVATLANAATWSVNCDSGERVSPVLEKSSPGDIVLVSGTCSESVNIPSETVRVTLDGQGKTTIRSPTEVPGRAAHAIFIRGRDIVVRGLIVTGGIDGIHLSGQAAGASAIIENNTVHSTNRHGIHLDHGSVGRIAGNRVERVPGTGINIQESSVARIGFIVPARVGSNTVRDVQGHGIAVSYGSTAIIFGNSLLNNKGSGISVSRHSHADVIANSIGGNASNAIDVQFNSGVNLSSPWFPKEEPNKGSTDLSNGGFAISCAVGGYVAGPIGTVTGSKGLAEFTGGCIDRLAIQ